jgi:hypothetical protein
MNRPCIFSYIFLLFSCASYGSVKDSIGTHDISFELSYPILVGNNVLGSSQIDKPYIGIIGSKINYDIAKAFGLLWGIGLDFEFISRQNLMLSPPKTINLLILNPLLSGAYNFPISNKTTLATGLGLGYSSLFFWGADQGTTNNQGFTINVNGAVHYLMSKGISTTFGFEYQYIYHSTEGLSSRFNQEVQLLKPKIGIIKSL